MSDKQMRGKYTQEFKLEAVRQVKSDLAREKRIPC